MKHSNVTEYLCHTELMCAECTFKHFNSMTLNLRTLPSIDGAASELVLLWVSKTDPTCPLTQDVYSSFVGLSLKGDSF